MGTLQTVLFITALLLAIAATVLGMIFILPEKKGKSLKGFGKLIHDFFNFKFLVIEKIIQITYLFSTVFVVFYGFFSIFNFEKEVVSGGLLGITTETKWVGYKGFFMMIVGPIALRVAYEVLTMGIIAVKNLIQINRKLKNQNTEDSSEGFSTYKAEQYKSAPAANNAPAFCPKCGSKMQNGSCSNPECK